MIDPQNHFAAMFIISFAVDGATGANNNDACLNSVAQEFGNFAVITKNGVPLTPPNPLGLNFGKNNPDLNNVLPMAPGDQLLLIMHDTPAGLEVIIKDLTYFPTKFHSPSSLTAYLKAVFHDPVRGKDEKLYKRAAAQVQRDRQESKRLCFEGRGNEIEGVRGTLWAAYNGITEYVDFHRSAINETNWFENIWFGGGNRIKERALEEALSVTQLN